MDHLDAAERAERQLQRVNVQVRQLQEVRDLAIAAAYQVDGHPTTVIAARLRVSPQTVNKRLAALGVQLRSRGPQRRVNTVDDTGTGTVD